MRQRLLRWSLVLALFTGRALASGDPPEALSAEQRKELQAKWQKFTSRLAQSYRAGQMFAAAEAGRSALETARRLHGKSDHVDVASSLNNLAVVLQGQRKDAEAEALHRAALAMRRRLYAERDHDDVAVSRCATAGDDAMPKLTPDERLDLHALWKEFVATGNKKYDAGKPGAAARDYTKALAAARRLFPESEFPHGHVKLADSLNYLASARHAQRKYPEAEGLFREALAMRRQMLGGKDHPKLADSVNNLGAVLTAQDRNAEAEPLLREALAMYRRLHPKQDHPRVAEGLNSLGMVLEEQHKYAEAEPFYRELLTLRRRQFPRKDHAQLANSMNNLAHLLWLRGKYAEAASLFGDALDMRRRLLGGKDHRLLAIGLNNLGTVLNNQGKYTEAEPLFRDGLAMVRRLFPKQDHPDLANALNSLASVLDDQEKYAEAESHYRDALAMRRRLFQGRDHEDIASSLNNVAHVLQGQGKYQEAEPLFREALNMNRRLHPDQDHPETARNLFNLAVVLRQNRRDVDAADAARESLRMYRALAGAYAALGSEGDALTLAASYPLAQDNYLSIVRSPAAAPATVYAEVWGSKANLARVYERRALAARAAAADPAAAEVLAQLTARRRRRADLLLTPTPADPAARKQRDAALAALARDIAALDSKLRPLLPAVGRAEKLVQATPVDLQQALPADAAVVDFLRYRLLEQDPEVRGKAGRMQTETYVAFVVTRDRVAQADLGPAIALEEAVASWRKAILGGQDVPAAIPARVRDLAWAKIRKEIPAGVRVVYIAPDLALCRLPWAALPGDAPGTILLEDYAVAVVPHAPFLLDKLWRGGDAPGKRHMAALVVGGVAYDDAPAAAGRLARNRDLPIKPDQHAPWPKLSGAAAEANGVAVAAARRKLDVRTLGDEKASAAAVLAALPQVRYAHLATHGFFAAPSFRSAFQVDARLFDMTKRGERIGAGALSPMVMTGLVFAGANKPDTPGRGIVTGEALVDLDLSGLELAVLSACETGLGDVAGGEGTFGLQRAFHLAGTRDVVASLWKVPDQPTAALMAVFYRNLWDKGLAPLEALRQAQLEIYRHPERIAALADDFRGKERVVQGKGATPVPAPPDGKAHPRLWAAFSLSGPGR